jgi:signal transduction histidine kinase
MTFRFWPPRFWPPRFWPPRFWPRSLAARTATVLLIGLVVVQGAGLTIHALDRLDLQRFAQMREITMRMMGVYRAVAPVPAGEAEKKLSEIWLPPDLGATLSSNPPTAQLPIEFSPEERLVRVNLNMIPMSATLRPHEVRILGGPHEQRMVVGLLMPNGLWLNVEAAIKPLRPWHSPGFLVAFLSMTVAAALLTLWAVRRLTLPVRTLAAAAEALGRDVNAPPLPEAGPLEVATAAAAFNTMATRIRRFVQDRTEMLTAIGHDLRTPITRLKLRAEFMEDEELRRKMLADLDELESMVSATLAFGRDASTTEPVSPIDLAELLRTVLDEAGDARPEAVERLAFSGPSHLTVRVRPLSLKRALSNLVTNALTYGSSANVRLIPAYQGMLRIEIEDDGPGIPASDLERVFEPFYRVEASRNNETGGVGLGLPIARNILRAHGGDVTLANRPTGGARAVVTLPA